MKVYEFSYGQTSSRIYIQPVLHSFISVRLLKSDSQISFPNKYWARAMKNLLIFSLLFSLSNLSYSQLSREEKLRQLESRNDIKVTEVEPNLLKLDYTNGKSIVKNVGDYKPQTNNYQLNYSPTYDSTIIDLRYIDTTLYYYKYSFWKEVPLTNLHFNHITVGDVNSNGLSDLYGSRKFFWSDPEPVSIYELNIYGHFDFRYQYASEFVIWNIYDVDKDSIVEVHLLGSTGDQRFFSKPTETSFATELKFSFYYPAQLNDQTLGDFDGDENTDLLFVKAGWPDVHIFEYNPVINNFDSVYRFEINEPAPWDEGGFSISDFDLDKKTDIVFGTSRGNVFVLENEGENQYTNSWQGSVESYHAYIHTFSNDIDKNGRPEFWVLADAYYNGIGTTRITIFETNGDNSYEAVGRVDLVGIFSFYAGTMQAVDIDKDGTEEIAVCIDQNFLILKFNGSRDHHSYELYYIKQNELAAAGENSVYFGATVYDLKNNGDMNLLISMDHVILQGAAGRWFTRIFKPDSLTVSNDIGNNIPKSPELKQNYPNPFNPSTSIRFEIGQSSNVSVKVYNILGKEIRLLLEENLPTGEYTIQWDGKDDKGNFLPGGVYFIQMKADNYQHTIKSVLLK